MKRLVLLLVTLIFSALALAAVNINTATKEELDAVPGIGPVKAQAIIDYRVQNGPFKTPEDIMKVSGIKEREFSKLKGLISVSGASPPAEKGATKEQAEKKVTVPTKAATPAPKADPETETWQAAESAGSAADYKIYLDTYPNGRFAAAARIKLNALEKGNAPQPKPIA